MKLLAIDSSANVASAALMSDGVLIGEISTNYKKTHSQTLMPMIDALLRFVETDIRDIDLFAAANGPGSFTGLRIGLATIKGLAHACDKPVVGVSTLAALAYNVPCCDGLIVPIMDARRDQVYTAAYVWKGNALQSIIEPCAVSIYTLLDNVKAQERRTVFLGDGVARFGDEIRAALGGRASFVAGNACLQRASSVAAAALALYAEQGAGTYNEIQPIYLRKSQAEREYEEKQKESNRRNENDSNWK